MMGWNGISPGGSAFSPQSSVPHHQPMPHSYEQSWGPYWSSNTPARPSLTQQNNSWASSAQHPPAGMSFAQPASIPMGSMYHSQHASPANMSEESNSSDPNGHDLGFLSLAHESSHSHDDLLSNGSSGDASRPSERASHGYSDGNVTADQKATRQQLDEHLGTKRRRGRPVGSKDRQPRVKRSLVPEPEDVRIDQKDAGGRRKPWKIILTADQAVQIYMKRPLGTSSVATSSCRSNEVAEQYGVNSKTIRDIWNRSTWVKATRHCWTAEEEADYINSQVLQNHQQGAPPPEEEGPKPDHSVERKRARGRPKGARDTRPRTKRKQGGSDGEEDHNNGHDRMQGQMQQPPQPQHSHTMLRQGMQMPMGMGGQNIPPNGSMQRDANGSGKMRHSNTTSTSSHSQSSSYPTDDSQNGATSDGSGSGHSPRHQPGSPKNGNMGMHRPGMWGHQDMQQMHYARIPRDHRAPMTVPDGAQAPMPYVHNGMMGGPPPPHMQSAHNLGLYPGHHQFAWQGHHQSHMRPPHMGEGVDVVHWS